MKKPADYEKQKILVWFARKLIEYQQNDEHYKTPHEFMFRICQDDRETLKIYFQYFKKSKSLQHKMIKLLTAPFRIIETADYGEKVNFNDEPTEKGLIVARFKPHWL